MSVGVAVDRVKYTDRRARRNRPQAWSSLPPGGLCFALFWGVVQRPFKMASEGSPQGGGGGGGCPSRRGDRSARGISLGRRRPHTDLRGLRATSHLAIALRASTRRRAGRKGDSPLRVPFLLHCVATAVPSAEAFGGPVSEGNPGFMQEGMAAGANFYLLQGAY